MKKTAAKRNDDDDDETEHGTIVNTVDSPAETFINP